MIKKTDLDSNEGEQRKKIRRLIKSGIIRFAGNWKLKIYGRLDCNSGKRMKPENRVFFENETEVLQKGYRPCGHCMPKRYRE